MESFIAQTHLAKISAVYGLYIFPLPILTFHILYVTGGRRKVEGKRKLGEPKAAAKRPALPFTANKKKAVEKKPLKIPKVRPVARPNSLTDSSDSSLPKPEKAKEVVTSKYFSPPPNVVPVKIDQRVKW